MVKIIIKFVIAYYTRMRWAYMDSC